MPVPLPTDNGCRHYIAYLLEKLAYHSIKLYINVVGIIHLEEGSNDLFAKSWYIYCLLKGVKRCRNFLSRRIFYISFFPLINFSVSEDVTFWAFYLVAFFPFFGKTNCLCKDLSSFNFNYHLCRKDAVFSPDGVVLDGWMDGWMLITVTIYTGIYTHLYDEMFIATGSACLGHELH